MVFKIKSSLFEDLTIKKVGAEKFLTYCTLKNLVSQKKSPEVSITEIAKHIRQSKNKVINSLVALKEGMFIGDVKVLDNRVKFNIDFLDLSPKHDEPYVWIDMDIINKILECGLGSKHALTYILLSRFKDEHCNISFKGMEDLIGVSHTTLNDKVCIDLEQQGFISNYFKHDTTHKRNGKRNNFFILRDIKNFETFKEEHKERATRNYGDLLVRKYAVELFG